MLFCLLAYLAKCRLACRQTVARLKLVGVKSVLTKPRGSLNGSLSALRVKEIAVATRPKFCSAHLFFLDFLLIFKVFCRVTTFKPEGAYFLCLAARLLSVAAHFQGILAAFFDIFLDASDLKRALKSEKGACSVLDRRHDDRAKSDVLARGGIGQELIAEHRGV